MSGARQDVQIQQERTRQSQERGRNSTDRNRSENRARDRGQKSHHAHRHDSEKQADRRDTLQALSRQAIAIQRDLVASLRQRLVNALRSGVQREQSALAAEAGEKTASLKNIGLNQDLVQGQSALQGPPTVHTEVANAKAGQSAQAGASTQSQGAVVETKLTPAIVRAQMRERSMAEPSAGARAAQLDYRSGRRERPDMVALRARGKSHEEIKLAMSAHLQLSVFMMLHLWSVFFRKLQKKLKEKEKEIGEKPSTIPESFMEIVRQMRFSARDSLRDSVNRGKEAPAPEGALEQKGKDDGVAVAA